MVRVEENDVDVADVLWSKSGLTGGQLAKQIPRLKASRLKKSKGTVVYTLNWE